MTEPVAEPVAADVSVAPDTPAAPVERVKRVKPRALPILDLTHVLDHLKLTFMERNNAVYVRAKWFVEFFWECRQEHVAEIVRDLREIKELSQEIVTLKVGKEEDEWFTLAGARIALGKVPFRLMRAERVAILEEFKKLEPKPAVVAGEARVEPKVVKLKDGQETVLKMKQEEGKEGDGDGWLDVRVVWLNGKEYLSTRDVVKHMIEKTGIQVVRAWTKVKPVVGEEVLATHKFKGSGEAVQDVIERNQSRGLLKALTGEAADRNRARMMAAIQGQNDGEGPVPVIREEQLLEALDEFYPDWFERATGVPGAKRARRA